jgi:hypothetical protein
MLKDQIEAVTYCFNHFNINYCYSPHHSPTLCCSALKAASKAQEKAVADQRAVEKQNHDRLLAAARQNESEAQQIADELKVLHILRRAVVSFLENAFVCIAV